MIPLLQKEMSRQEFLVTSGTILLGLIGVTALLTNVSKLLEEHSGKAPSRRALAPKQTFGGGAYGV